MVTEAAALPRFRALCRNDFFTFLQCCHQVSGGRTKIEGKYLELVVEILRSIHAGEPDHVIINLPPRTLKSFVVSVATCCWELGQRPGSEILIVTGNADLARGVIGKIKRVASSDWFNSVFPVRIRRQGKDEISLTNGGIVRARTIRTGFTGIGADLIIVDDPAGIPEAPKKDILLALNNVFDTLVRSRSNNNAAERIVICAHRISEHDLTGHLKDEGNWNCLALPSIVSEDTVHQVNSVIWHRKTDEPLRPGSMSLAKLDGMRRKGGTPSADALYQQNPSGRPFDKIIADCFRRCGAPPDSYPRIISIDPAQSKTGSSFSAIQVWATNGAQHILIDGYRGHVGLDGLCAALRTLAKKHLPSVVLIEDNGHAQGLKKYCSRLGFECILVGVGNRTKIDRLVPHVALIRSGAIQVDRSFAGILEFVEEVCEFPSGQNSDQVDALTLFLDFATKTGLPPRRQRALGTIRRCW